MLLTQAEIETVLAALEINVEQTEITRTICAKLRFDLQTSEAEMARSDLGRPVKPTDIFKIAAHDALAFAILRMWQDGTIRTWEEAMTLLAFESCKQRARLLKNASYSAERVIGRVPK